MAKTILSFEKVIRESHSRKSFEKVIRESHSRKSFEKVIRERTIFLEVATTKIYAMLPCLQRSNWQTYL